MALAWISMPFCCGQLHCLQDSRVLALVTSALSRNVPLGFQCCHRALRVARLYSKVIQTLITSQLYLRHGGVRTLGAGIYAVDQHSVNALKKQ
jgi:hypothetical protein